MSWQVILSYILGLITGVGIFIIILHFMSGFVVKLNKDLRIVGKEEINKAVKTAKDDIRIKYGLKSNDEE